MPANPNKLSQFWQELKRRKVIKVIAMYAGAAYVLIELANNVGEPLNLPDWTPRLVILIALVGFPVVTILSWIFDITPDGIKKTDKVQEKEYLPVAGKRKLRLSDGIIAVLFVTVCILLYPKIFRADKFENIRDPDGRISVAVMPFQNMTGDTIWNIWQDGIQNDLITNLSNSDELSVRSYQTMFDILRGSDKLNQAALISSQASDISQRIDAHTYILGSIKSAGNKIRVNAQLIDADTEEIYKAYQIDGNTEEDIFIISDSLSRLIRGYLETNVLKKDIDEDIRKYATTQSTEALKYFIQANYSFFKDNDFETAVNFYNKALETDSNFYAARILLIPLYLNLQEYDKAKLCLQKTYSQREKLPIYNQLELDMFSSMLNKDIQGCIKYLRLMLKQEPETRIIWFQLGMEYHYAHQFEESIEANEKALEIDKRWGSNWEWAAVYVVQGTNYHLLGQHDKEQEVYDLGRRNVPNHPEIIFGQAVCALSMRDSVQAGSYMEKYRTIMKAAGTKEYHIEYDIGSMLKRAGEIDKAIETFRNLINAFPDGYLSKYELGRILIEQEIDLHEGMSLINQALEYEPDNSDFLYTKGLVYYKQGKAEESIEILNRAWDLRPVYEHDHFSLLKEVEQTLARQNN